MCSGYNFICCIINMFCQKSGHRKFAKVPIPEQCPQPVIIMDEDTINNADQSVSKEVEEYFGRGSYYFYTAQDPNPDNSVYQNKEKVHCGIAQSSNSNTIGLRREICHNDRN